MTRDNLIVALAMVVLCVIPISAQWLHLRRRKRLLARIIDSTDRISVHD